MAKSALFKSIIPIQGGVLTGRLGSYIRSAFGNLLHQWLTSDYH